MSAERDAVERLSQLSAEACAGVMSTLSGTPSTATELSVAEADDLAFDDLGFPLVSVCVPFKGAVKGDNVFLLQRAEAGTLAQAMMAGMLGDAAGDEEIELSAVSEAMNQMMGGASSAIADELAIDIDIEPPRTNVIESAGELPEIPAGSLIVRYRLGNDEVAAHIVQVVPPEFAAVLAQAHGAAAAMRDALGERPASGANAALAAVERTARISAEAAATVLTTLLGDETEATMPSIDVDPEDPFSRTSFPAIAVQVQYISGVTGNNLFVLTPEQAALLAAVMMGSDEPQGDGLSEIELSAVSEAMNQMMGAATNTMADTLSLDIEVSPPTCTVLDSAEAAQALAADCAYLARFRLVSERFKADVVQLVSSDFAEHLERAFTAADQGRDVVAAGSAPAAGAPGQAGGWEALAAPPSAAAAMLHDVKVRVSAELGRTRLPVSRAANLPLGAVVKLDRSPADPLDVLINGRPFAQARLVLVDGEYAVQIIELTPFEVAA